jgi:preprotein translocase SecE subunit
LSQQDAENAYAATPPEDAGVLRRRRDFFEFLRKVKQEMQLVHRPNWQEVRSTTLVVIVFVFLFAFYLRFMDWIFSPLQKWIISQGP